MKRLIFISFLMFYFFSEQNIWAQGVSISTSGNVLSDSSSSLHLIDSTKGFLMNRMTAANKNSISNPATGLIVYQTDDTIGFYYYENYWKRLSSTNSSVEVFDENYPDGKTNLTDFSYLLVYPNYYVVPSGNNLHINYSAIKITTNANMTYMINDDTFAGNQFFRNLILGPGDTIRPTITADSMYLIGYLSPNVVTPVFIKSQYTVPSNKTLYITQAEPYTPTYQTRKMWFGINNTSLPVAPYGVASQYRFCVKVNSNNTIYPYVLPTTNYASPIWNGYLK